MIDAKHYNFAFLDEGSKREIRRSILKAVAIPGYQVPFGSRELPIGRGWGTGGIQITLSIIGPEDTLKVIDQGSDDSVNAVNIKKLVKECTDVEITTDSEEASIIQSRHRIPEIPMRNDQILVLQVPTPEPLRIVEPKESVTKQMHAEAEYSAMWLSLFEDLTQYGEISIIHLRKVEIGYVSQFLTILPRTTAKQHVINGALDAGFSYEESVKKAEEMLRYFKLSENLWDIYPNTFSGGEKLRLNLAHAMVKAPRLLLLDEPTASLDNSTKILVKELLMKLKAEGTSMIGIFHDLEFMEGLCDHVYNISQGSFQTEKEVG